MDKATRNEIEQWLLKAENDLKSAALLLNHHDAVRDTGVYHCQQAVEKLLKDFLSYCEVPFSKTYDLRVLTKTCIEHDPSFEILFDAADILTPYAIAFRYPGDVLEPSKEDAQEALKLAQMVHEYVFGKLSDVL